ncbi:hypothetical protein [Methanosarcina barkeri]|uniref:hypothetical protein n=1 Tax=Methanosarcina barkeri TaxID=2208 RepID=UPI001FB1DBBC|nr:hypothetical protein [Methanosarcina barkeri]
MREAAASALGDLKAQQAVPKLVEILEKPDRSMQKSRYLLTRENRYLRGSFRTCQSY